MKPEVYRDKIAALVPFYDDDGGSSTRLHTRDGDIITDRRTVRWILKKLARELAIDLEALRKIYGEYLSLSQGVPLPFSENMVMVPLKLRRVIGENDGAGGYVNVCAVEGVEESAEDDNYKSLVHLKGGGKVFCLFTRRTVDRRLRLGRLARERYLYNSSRSRNSFFAREDGGESEVPPELLMAMGKLLLQSLNSVNRVP